VRVPRAVCDTKRDCNELATVLGQELRAQALHGDIPQQQREARRRAPQPCGACVWGVGLA